MRALHFCLFALLPLAACGGGGTDTDLGVDGGSDSGVTDLGADDAAADMSNSSLRHCVPVSDVGTCPAGEHCSITDQGGTLSYGNCVVGPGDPLAEGAACARHPIAHHTDILADACGDQHACDRPNASHPAVCYRLCAATSDCPAGELCEVIANVSGSSVVAEGLCVANAMCDPLAGTGCAAGESCAVLRDTHGTGFGTLCLDVSTTPLADGAMCSSSSLCALGSACANRRLMDGGVDSTMPVCQRYCDRTADPDAGAPHACAAGHACVPYPSGSGLPANLGLCAP